MLIPIGHEKRVQRFPYVTIGLMILNLLIFVPTWYGYLAQIGEANEIIRKIERIDPLYAAREEMKNDPRYEMMEEAAGRSFDLTEFEAEKLDELELELEELRESFIFNRFGSRPSHWNPLTAISSAFLHAGWLHLIGNMFFLWMVGFNMEDRWGPWFFALFYIFGGIAAAGAHALSLPGDDMPLVGASGAVAAVMGAFLLRNAKTKIKFLWIILIVIYPVYGTFKAPAFIMLPLWILREILFASLEIQPGVANWAHIGGFAFGALAGLVLWQSGLEDSYFLPKYSLEGEEHDVPEEYTKAHELLSQGNKEEAINKFKNVAAQHGGYLPALAILSKIYAEDKNRDELLAITDRIVKTSFAKKDMHFTIEAFQRLIKIFPDASLQPVVQYRMADEFAKVTMYQEAVWAYRNLAAVYPKEMLAQKALLASADLLANKMGMHENAIQMYEYIIQYFPGGPVAAQAQEKLNQVKAVLGR